MLKLPPGLIRHGRLWLLSMNEEQLKLLEEVCHAGARDVDLSDEAMQFAQTVEDRIIGRLG